MQIASGLAAAHAQGLIHRDVKPSNILLQNGIERVQITDFGLARAADDAAVTRTGEVAGTPQYMSPEQARGDDVDTRSDLFSFGCVLYAMCTGRSPFRAETTMASLHRVCNDTPRPIRETSPEAPEWLATIVNRLLEKNPNDRFQTASEVADQFSLGLAHVQNPDSAPIPGGAGVAKRSKSLESARRPRWIVAAIIFLVFIAAFVVSEATGVTSLSGTVVRIVTGEGTLVIEVDDPSMQVSLNGGELSITGAGLQEFKLRPGQYRFQAIKNGQPVKTELISILRGGRRVVRVTREVDAPPQAEIPLAVPCVVQVIREIDVRARMDGAVKSVLKADGSHVEEGEVVVLLNDELARAQAEIARNNYELSTKEVERLRGNGDEAALRSATLTSQLKQAELHEMEAAVERMQISAPMKGVVDKLQCAPGDVVKAGDPICRIRDLEQLKVWGAVSSSVFSPKEVLNHEVKLEIDLPSREVAEFRGKITFAEPFSTKTIAYATIENRLENGIWVLRPGLEGRMIFQRAKTTIGANP
jgi:biotin carboxyl carrier protein